MEHGPWHLPISSKMHSQPYLSISNSDYTRAWTRVIEMNWISPSWLMPMLEYQRGIASPSVMTRLPAVLEGASRKRKKTRLRTEFFLVVSLGTIVAPIERVKLLMQSQNAMVQSGRLSKPYKGIFNCFATTIRNEGVISLWRGNTATIMGQCSNLAVNFAIASYSKNPDGRRDHDRLKALNGLSIACLAAGLLVEYPLKYAGTRLANDIKIPSQVGKWQFSGIVDVYRKTLQSDGIYGLYRGYSISLFMNAVKPIASKGLSAVLPGLMGLQGSNLASEMVVLGYALRVILVTYPMDTVSKRMMMTSGEAIKYKNLSDAFSQILKMEGIGSFYKGGRAELLRMTAFYGLFMFLAYLWEDDATSYTARWMKGKGEEV